MWRVPGRILLLFLAGCGGVEIRRGPPRVGVAELLRSPGLYEGREVRLVGMYATSGATGFRLLPRTAPVWEKGDGPGVKILRDKRTFRPWEILEVRGRFRVDPPRLEAEKIRRRGDPLFRAESLSLVASGLAGAGNREKLERALGGTISPAARHRAHMRLGVFCEKAGGYATAMKHFTRADDYTRDPAEKKAARTAFLRVGKLESKRRHIDDIGDE